MEAEDVDVSDTPTSITQFWMDRLIAERVAEAREAMARDLHDRIDRLPVWDRRTVPGGKHVLRRLVHQEITYALRRTPGCDGRLMPSKENWDV